MTKTVNKTAEFPNLTPFPKGVSGNLNGRPKKEFSITEGIREYIAEDDPEKKKSRKDILVEKVVTMALRGDKEMIKYTIDRLEGAPKGSAPIIPIQQNFYLDNKIAEKEAVEYLKELGYKIEKPS